MEDAEPAAEPEPALAASVSAKGSSVDASGSLETRSRSRAVPAATGRSERYGAGGCSADALAAGQRAARALREAQGGARTILQRGRGGDEEELIGGFGGRVESLGADELELGGRHFRTRESSCGVSGWKHRSSAVRSCPAAKGVPEIDLQFAPPHHADGTPHTAAASRDGFACAARSRAKVGTRAGYATMC